MSCCSSSRSSRTFTSDGNSASALFAAVEQQYNQLSKLAFSMPSESKVYLAGVGFSPVRSGNSSEDGAITSLISAATKSLLDAGVTFDDVSRGVRSNKSSDGAKAFKAFDEGGIPVDEVESGTEFENAFRLIKKGSAQCVLMLSVDKSGAVAFVLISERFILSHAYLKDSSALIRESSSKGEEKGPHDVCKLVWALRGWSEGASGKEARLEFKTNSKQTFELSRADGKEIPKWKEVEPRQDGKHRLGHNPATETKEISREDFDAVRAIGKGRSKANNQTQFKEKGGDRAALARL